MVGADLTFLENNAIKPSIEIGAFEALWSSEISSFKQLREKIDSTQTNSLSNLVDQTLAKQYYDETIHRLHDAGIHRFGIKVEGTIDYPEKLYDADYPLPFLYYQGNWDLVFTRGVAVVGTRHPSIEGIRRTKKLVKGLVEAGLTIYSGLASGIDTAAHQAAIEFGGSTVAVAGTPLWLCYPKENEALKNEIVKHHLLISQVPVLSYNEKEIKFTRIFFPERNKTMSALSEATIIIEAGETSGTLVQAKAALKQKRKVFILNSNFENPKLNWPHKLQELGAIRVFEIDDILQGLDGANQIHAD